MPPRSWVSSTAHEALVRLLVSERQRCGLSQRALAERLGKPPNFVARIETGQRNVSVVEFVVIAQALGVEPASMFAGLLRVLPEDLRA